MDPWPMSGALHARVDCHLQREAIEIRLLF